MIVPKPRPSATPRERAYTIKLALAFVAIYIIWGSTYLAIRYAVETIPPLVTAGIRHSIAGAVMLAWAWMRGCPTRQHWLAGLGRRVVLPRGPRDAALGGAVCRLRPGRAAACDRAHVHLRAGMDDGTTKDQRPQRAGSGSRRGWCGHAHGTRADQRVKFAGTACRAGGLARLVGGSGDLSAAQAA